MSFMRLFSGVGNGSYGAKVDNENRLWTRAVNIPHISGHAVNSKNAFITRFEHTIQAADTDEIVGYITYTGDNYLTISSITFSTDSEGKTQFESVFNPTNLAGGVATTPTNLHGDDNKTVSVTAVDTNQGATPITWTADSEIEVDDIMIGWQAMPTFVHNYDDALIMPKGTTLAIIAESAAIGDVVKANIRYFEGEIGI